MNDSRDLLILGGGLVGMTLALAAARQGLSSHVVDRADPAQMTADGFDGRASAISTASWNLFGNIGLAERLEPYGCPISSIAVTDQLKPGQIEFAPGEHGQSLGRMFANQKLRIALFEAAQDEDLIAWHSKVSVAERNRDAFGVSATFEGGKQLHAKLMIAAEGRQSPTRDQAGIAIAKWDYRHRAIISGLVHEKPHQGVAWEIFYPAGPFALLPMLDSDTGEHCSALVWTVDQRDGDAVLVLSERAFQHEVEKRMGGLYGTVKPTGKRMSFPLGFHHTAKVTGDRLALVGDSAHGIHPIAGQGLNLGLRDVGALVEVLSDGLRLGLDIGDAQLLARYERWRGLDSFSVALATDGLTRLFGIPGRTASAVRRLGMAAVQKTGPLKNWFMDEARGVSGKVPQLMRG